MIKSSLSFNWLLFLGFYLMLFPLNLGADTLDSNGKWVKMSDEIAFSIKAEKSLIITFIKNISKNFEQVQKNEKGLFVSFYYLDKKGTRIPVGEPPAKKSPFDYVVTKSPEFLDLPAEGHIPYQIGTTITSEEEAILKDNPVILTIKIYTPSEKKTETLESLPVIIKF